MNKSVQGIIKSCADEMKKINESLAAGFNDLEADQKMTPHSRAKAQRAMMNRAQMAAGWVKENARKQVEALKLDLQKQTFGGDENDSRYFSKVEEVANLAGKSLVEKFRKAEIYNDKTTMRACAARAVETGNAEIIESYAAADATFRANVGEYGEYIGATKSKGANLAISMSIGGLMKPRKDGNEWKTYGPEGKPVQHFDTSGAPVFKHDARPDARPDARSDPAPAEA